jgi:proteasome lid subunit RPN8/RPN11
MTFAQPTLRLTRSQYEQIVAHCYAGYPLEACGLLVGTVLPDFEPTGKITRVVPCRNAEESSVVYRIDDRDYKDAQDLADREGDEIVGCWHSHTHTRPYPSPTDVRQAEWLPNWVFVIVSLASNFDGPSLRAYRIRGGEVAEVPVALGRG